MKPEDAGKHRGNTGDKSASKKKPYSTPRLTTYGHISKLTASGSKALGDKAKRMNCL